MNNNGQKERCKMIEERVIYHDDNSQGTHAEINIIRNSANNTKYIDIHIQNESETGIWLHFDTETAYMFAKDILRKVEQIEKEEE